MQPAIEFPASPVVNHAVYLKGQNVVVKVRWRNTNTFALTGTLTVQEAALAFPNPGKTIGTYNFPLTVSPTGPIAMNLPANGGTQEVAFTFSVCPNYVAVGWLRIKFNLPLTDGEMWANNGTNGNFRDFERICFLNNSPVGMMQPLWSDMAEYSCRWAFGSTSDVQVRRQMTKGMYNSDRCPKNINVYNKLTGMYFDLVHFNLGRYLHDIGDPGVDLGFVLDAPMDCRDFAGILKFSMECQGVAANCQKVFRTDEDAEGDPMHFYYWPLCPSGRDPAVNSNYSDEDFLDDGAFAMHVVVESGGLRFDSSSSYKFNLDGSERKNPVWEWQVLEHWQKASFFEWRGLVHNGSVKCEKDSNGLYPPSEFLGYVLITPYNPMFLTSVF
jgi:hypothetical protein